MSTGQPCPPLCPSLFRWADRQRARPRSPRSRALFARRQPSGAASPGIPRGRAQLRLILFAINRGQIMAWRRRRFPGRRNPKARARRPEKNIANPTTNTGPIIACLWRHLSRGSARDPIAAGPPKWPEGWRSWAYRNNDTERPRPHSWLARFFPRRRRASREFGVLYPRLSFSPSACARCLVLRRSPGGTNDPGGPPSCRGAEVPMPDRPIEAGRRKTVSTIPLRQF